MRKKKTLSHLYKATRKDVFTFMDHLSRAGDFSVNDKPEKILKAYRSRLEGQFRQLEESQELSIRDLQNIIEDQKKEIRFLKKEKESISSDNYLLEYKKKDLMLLAAQLEEAYEEIEKKNTELAAQKKHIQEQAWEIKKVSDKVLKKNDELEQQKEFILDQADYLEEANKQLSKINIEVENQKEEILRKNKELLELDTEKNNLIHIVAHDLKSPLNQIKGLISLIKFNPDQLSPDSKNCLDMMDGSVNRLNEMIAKILDVKAIESQKLNINMERENLSELAKEVAHRYRLSASEKGISLTEDIEEDIAGDVDRGFFVQVMENLLSNAIKFSESDTSILFKVAYEGGKPLISVRDQGPGLSRADMEKLFTKFQKLSARPTGNETSTGLGLSIVKKFVEAMEGETWCESEPGKGATFYVRLKGQVSETAPEKKALPGMILGTTIL